MSTSDAEYEAVSRVVKADRRFRVFQYSIAVFFLILSCAVMWEMHHKFEQLEDKVTDAIEQIKTQNEETRRFNTCLLLVPISERSSQKQLQCFNEIDKPGGLDRGDFETSPPTRSGSIQPVVSPNQMSDSYSNDNSSQATPSVTNDTPTQEPPASPQPDNRNAYQRLIDAVVRGTNNAVTGVTHALDRLGNRL